MLNNIKGTINGKIPEKKFLIDNAFDHQPISSIDLGDVWGVDGACTFYCLGKYKVDSAIFAYLEFTVQRLRK